MVYLYDYAASNNCECPECGKDFITKKTCGQAACPYCDHVGCNDMEFPEEDSVWREFIGEFPDAASLSPFAIITETAVVAKDGNQWCVFSETGRKLGCYGSKPAAEKRLKQIEMFKHMKMKSGEEFGKQECECGSCGAIFWTSTRCDLSICPVCHEQDDIDELTGVL
jgi:hypothetical protein